MQPCWHCFPRWWHKCLWPMQLLQWWLQTDQLHCRCYGAFAVMNDCNWCNQFYRGCFGTFTIVEGCGLATYCGEGLVVALHSICSPKALCDERLIAVLQDVRCQLPLWQEAYCCTQPSCHSWQGVHCCQFWQRAHCHPPQQMLPPWRSCHIHPWQCSWHLWFIRMLSLAYSLYLTLVYLRCWLMHCVIWLSLHPANNNINFLIVVWEWYLSFPHLCCYCPCYLQYDIKELLSRCWCLHRGVAINLIAGVLHLCNHWCGWSTLMKKGGCHRRDLTLSS